MAFIQTDDGLGLVRDRFPPQLVRNTTEAKDYDCMDDTAIKPIKFERLFDWAFVAPVVPSLDRTRTMQCVHKPPPDMIMKTSSLKKVAIRFFAFLGKHNLTPTGNWDRTSRGVIKAVMYLTLEAGSYPDEFAQQRRQLEDLRKMAYRYLGKDSAERSQFDRELYLQRRVFRKGATVPSWMPLEPAELLDPNVSALIPKWRLDGIVNFGRRTSSGALRVCNPLAFSMGDFVDVTATLDIATITKNGSTKSKIHFSFTHVIQLCPADKVTTLMQTISEDSGLSRTIAIQDTGLVLEEDRGESDEER